MSSTESAVADATDAAAATTAQSGKQIEATVLCVDDEKPILSAMKRVFRRSNYRVLTANSGKEALEVLEKETVDVVVSDMRMPEMDGAELLTNVANTWPETMRILLTGYSDMDSTIKAINQGQIYHYLKKPWEDEEVRLWVRNALEQKQLKEEKERLTKLTEKQNAELQEWNTTLEDKVRQRTGTLRKALKLLENINKRLEEHYISTVGAFSGLIELKTGQEQGQAMRIARRARMVAKAMGLEDKAQEHIYVAGLVHDIGLVGIPDPLVRKPFEKMTEEEKGTYRTHTTIGEMALMSLERMEGVLPMVRHHHERVDGMGYPDRLSGDAIPLGARIVGVIADYESLKCGLLTGSSMNPEEARGYLVSHASQRYDEKVVNEVVKVLEQEEEVEQTRRFNFVSFDELAPGMIVAEELRTAEGVLLLPKDKMVSKRLLPHLQRLKEEGCDQVRVYSE